MRNDPSVIDEMLTNAKTIAVLGMSDKSWRASYNIGRYLAASGYRVLPVNPEVSQILGMQSHPDLDAAQTAAQAENGAGIDLVDVFRASEHVPAIVDDVIRLGIPYLWLQDDVDPRRSDSARPRRRGQMCPERLHLQGARRASKPAPWPREARNRSTGVRYT